MEIYLILNGKKIIKDVDNKNQFEGFIQQIKEASNFNDIYYSKVWLLEDDGNPIAVYNIDIDKITYYQGLVFQGDYYLDNGDEIDIEYSKFICSAWGSLLYLNYSEVLLEYEKNDIRDFMNEFSIDEIKKLTHSIQTYQEYENDDNEWVCDGMRMKNGKEYLTKNVVDYLFGSSITHLVEPLEIFRTEGYGGGEKNDTNYKAWVSATTNPVPYEGFNKNKYILPIGFPIINTKINGEYFADINEIIVRSEDLKKL